MAMMEHAELTQKIIGCCYQVINELGAGFLESVYENALIIALREKGLRAERQMPYSVTFRGQTVGDFFADIVVENIVVLELKAVKALAPEHQAQSINYLKATCKPVGLLVETRAWKLNASMA